MRKEFNKDTLFYWDLEPDFKPFSNKENIRHQSEKFKADEEDKFYNYFLSMIEMIKRRYE